jgi:hypothetical protein
MMNVAALPQSSGSIRSQPNSINSNSNNMLYKPSSNEFQTGNRLLPGYSLSPEELHGMSHPHQVGGYPHSHQDQHQFPRHFVSHYDNISGGGHHNGHGSRPQYQQRMTDWPQIHLQQQQQQQQQQQHHVYTTYHPTNHQSFCGQTNESNVLLNGDQCGWTVRNSTTVRQSDNSSVQNQHQISSERDNYLLHSSSSHLPNNKRRLSIENSSTLYDQLPPTPYSSEPPTPSYHSSYSSSSSTYLAPSPSSSVNLTCPLTNDPFNGSRASIPLEHFPPTPNYSEDLHSPNSEHSGYTSSASTTPPSALHGVSGNQENHFENGRESLSCLTGYDSQRSRGDDQLDHRHSSSFDATDQVPICNKYDPILASLFCFYYIC